MEATATDETAALEERARVGVLEAEVSGSTAFEELAAWITHANSDGHVKVVVPHTLDQSCCLASAVRDGIVDKHQSRRRGREGSNTEREVKQTFEAAIAEPRRQLRSREGGRANAEEDTIFEVTRVGPRNVGPPGFSMDCARVVSKDWSSCTPGAFAVHGAVVRDVSMSVEESVHVSTVEVDRHADDFLLPVNVDVHELGDDQRLIGRDLGDDPLRA
jgi:hypothetical protein